MDTANTGAVYLDHAAATPLDPRVLRAMEPYFGELFYNPSAPYAPAVTVRRDFEDARSRIARLLAVKPDEIIFTSGATESINVAFHSVLSDGGEALVPTVEHHAVLRTAERYPHHVIVPTDTGVIRPESVAALLGDDTRLVSIALANNELGTVQDLTAVGAVVADERARRQRAGIATPLYFHTDASQGSGLLELKPARLGVDLMTLNAGKMYGPKGVGLLWASSDVSLSPLLFGGGQERGVRSGTENVAGVIGFARAFELADGARKTEMKRIGVLRDMLEKRLTDAFKDVVLTRAPQRLANFVHAAWPGLDAERVVFLCEAKGVFVATGSACAANEGTRSHVLTAVGMPPTLADGSLRLTLGRETTEEQILRAADVITEAVRAERVRTGGAA